MFEHAELSVGKSPGFRTLSIRDPSFPNVEILVPMLSLNAAVCARHLMEGDPEPDEPLRRIEVPGNHRA